MASLHELSLKFDAIVKQSNELLNNNFVSKITPIANDIIDSGNSFFTKLNTVLSKFKDKHPNVLEYRSNRYYVINESRTIDFNYQNALNIAKEATSTINTVLKDMLNGDISQRNKTMLGVALNTFYLIIDSIKTLENNEIKKEKEAHMNDASIIEQKRREANERLKVLETDIREYFDNLPPDIRSLPLDKAYEAITSTKYNYSHQIDIGFGAGTYSKDFIKYVDSLGYSLNDNSSAFHLSYEEGKNVCLIDCEPSFLRRNADFEDALKDLIFRSFTNFRPNEFEVALIEGEDGEVMLGPVADFIKKASNDLIYEDDVADNNEKVSRLIRAL